MQSSVVQPTVSNPHSFQNISVDEMRANLRRGLTWDGQPATGHRETPCPVLNSMLNQGLIDPESQTTTKADVSKGLQIEFGARLGPADGWAGLVNKDTLHNFSHAHLYFPAGPGALVRLATDGTRANPHLWQQLCKVAAANQKCSVENLQTFTKDDLLLASELRLLQTKPWAHQRLARTTEVVELLWCTFARVPEGAPEGTAPCIPVQDLQQLLMENRVPENYVYKPEGNDTPAPFEAIRAAGAVRLGACSYSKRVKKLCPELAKVTDEDIQLLKDTAEKVLPEAQIGS